jgi:hypothetical protein
VVRTDTCVGCHNFFDPLGFSLEHYDQSGQWLDSENGLPLDASGTYFTFGGETLEFSSFDDLKVQLVESCEVQSCFAQQVFDYALNQAYGESPPVYDPGELRQVIREFREADLELAPLLMAIASTPAFLRE